MDSDYGIGTVNLSSLPRYEDGRAGKNGSDGSLGDLEDYQGLLRPPLLKQSTAMVILFTFAYVLVFVLALVNNSLVVSAIYRNTQLRTTTNYFLANLAIADILVSFIVLPITLLDKIFSEWQFGPFLCKSVPYLQAVAVSASVNTLTAVAVERYLAIFHSHRQIIRPNTALAIISIIWSVPMCVQIPWAVYYRHQTFRNPEEMSIQTHCYMAMEQPAQKGYFLGGVFIPFYIVPLSVITVFYSIIGMKVCQRSVAGIKGTQTEKNIQRSKIRIVRMLIVVAVVFAFSWLPLYSIKLRFLFGPALEETDRKFLVQILFPISQWLGAANSCVNPFIYCYFSEHFRKSVVAMLKSGSCCSKIHIPSSGNQTHSYATRIR